MPWSPLLDMPAVEQARLVARREISSEELTRLYLDRIEELNPKLHAFVEVWPEEALASARRKDAMVREGGRLPAFHGVPMGVKDLYFVRGHVTGFGSRAVRVRAPIDCRTTRSLRRGGFVLLGKTTTPELGVMPVTEPDTHAPTRNAWDPRRTAGGSSGGAGAAVAAAMLPIAHASDGAGSIRIPSALAHIYGMKPSRGRVPNAFGIRDRDIMYTCGPAARNVRDAAAMLDVLAGLDVNRPHWLAPPSRPYAETFSNDPGRLRIGLVVDNPVCAPDPRIVEATERVARLLEGVGHEIVRVSPPRISIEEFLPIYQLMVAQAPVIFPRRLQPVTSWLRDAGKKLKPEDVLRVQQRMTVALMQMMKGVDILLSPTVGIPIPEVGSYRNLPPDVAFSQAAAMGAFTASSNITGSPAANIPAGLLDGRHPIGVQIAARPGEDTLVLEVSHQLEQLMPWADVWAPIAGRPESH